MTEYAYDLNIEEFETKVLHPSMEVPVLVDFWAPWCGPCKVLKPMLEKLAEEYGGRFLLAKVNSDENPELAQHFGVRSIPTVKAIFGGRIVDEFSGALPEGQVRAFIDRLVPPAEISLRDQAAEKVAAGELDAALALLGEASQQNPQDEEVRLDAAEVLLALGRDDEALQLVKLEYTQAKDRAQALRTRLELAANKVDTAPLLAKLAANPDDHATRLELARAHAAGGEYREAFEAALEVVRRDRDFDEQAGRKALLQFFEMLAGSEQYGPLVREFRRRLSTTLN